MSDSETYQNLIVGKGESIVNGKTKWKDFIQVRIENKDDAFALAMDILRQVENIQLRGVEHSISFSLTGSLESESE